MATELWGYPSKPGGTAGAERWNAFTFAAQKTWSLGSVTPSGAPAVVELGGDRLAIASW